MLRLRSGRWRSRYSAQHDIYGHATSKCDGPIHASGCVGKTSQTPQCVASEQPSNHSVWKENHQPQCVEGKPPIPPTCRNGKYTRFCFYLNRTRLNSARRFFSLEYPVWRSQTGYSIFNVAMREATWTAKSKFTPHTRMVKHWLFNRVY